MPPVSVPQAFELALRHHHAGRLAEAEGLYRQILAAQPNHAEAFHRLGIIAHQVGRNDLAAQWMQQAVLLQPNNTAAHSNLGEVYRTLGRFEEAIASFRRALEMEPSHPEAHNNLGNALSGLGRRDEAAAAYRRALQLRPEYAEAHNNLGFALAGQGQFGEAVASYRQALELRPDYPEAWHNLGNALADRGELDEAVAAYRRTLQLKPDYAEAHCNLGTALAELHQLDEAVAAYQRALQIRPDLAEAHNNLGNACKDQGRIEEAIAAFRAALHLRPGQVAAHSNLIYALHFHPDQDDRMIVEEQQRWSEKFAEPLQRLVVPQVNARDPERRLRVGYVSPNFRRHPISHFLLPLLEAHDKTRVEIYCYASVRRGDDFTERVRKTADVWRDALGLGDHDLAERIRADQIDILVDLNQHMENNRLLTFARKSAPVQVAWLGYPASTGLPAMDYRFTDCLMEPEGVAWSESVETPIRLPDCWFCFHPMESLEPSALPAQRAGHVTFGSLNNFCKVNETVLRVWAAVLLAVEGSRLLLHCPAGATQTRVRQWFGARGVAAHRLELVARTATRADYLQLYQRIDVGLDPFPYNGGTTTCEALWMGVPVVSRAGRTAVSRMGLSVLTNLGLPEWVASSDDDYIRIATQLAQDLPGLAELRTTLRARMQASPLMDAPRFARNMEAAYRTMWQRWCAGPQS